MSDYLAAEVVGFRLADFNLLRVLTDDGVIGADRASYVLEETARMLEESDVEDNRGNHEQLAEEYRKVRAVFDKMSSLQHSSPKEQ